MGQERVARANDICDQLIAAEHTDAASVAEYKDTVNEAWTDLLELIDTRTQMLQASFELHKFYHDCKDILERIYVSIKWWLQFVSIVINRIKNTNLEQTNGLSEHLTSFVMEEPGLR